MKKHSAKTANECAKDFNAQLKATSTKVGEAGYKLLKDNDLTLEDINELGQCMSEQLEYRKEQLVVCDINELSKRLQLHENVDIEENPIFIFCQIEKNNAAAFCIVKLLGKTFCLYLHFSDKQIPEIIKSNLKQCFGDDIYFKINQDEIENSYDKNSQDVLSLKALETMMIHLKPHRKKDFIKDFDSPDKNLFECLKKGAYNLKKELFSYAKDSYYKIVVSDIDQLSKDIEFKKAIKELINSIPLVDDLGSFKAYQSLLKELAEIDENKINFDDSKIIDLSNRLEQAREVAFRKTKNLKIETFQNETGERQLDIVKRFPIQMEKLKRIFEPFVKSEINENLDKMLKEICSKLDLEYGKMRSFIEAQLEEKRDDNCDVSGTKNIEDIINDLPEFTPEDNNFVGTGKKLEQLLSEIILDESGTLNIKSLKEKYNKVKDFCKLWCDKKASHIHQWAVSRKGKLTDSEVYEALAIMDRSNELVTGGHKLHDTQIFSLLIFLHANGKGQLLQVQTGEGKTTIVSILAAIKALQGKTVDIVTSNPVLASDGVKNKELFYNLLSLNATTNNLDENYKYGARKCYKADIVYGSIGNFQFDYLKDSFLCLSTRAKRPFNCIILDEVDSMIIDNASHIAKLSGPLPGMESLKYIYIKIWLMLHKAEDHIVEELQKLPHNERVKLLYEQLDNEKENSLLERMKNYIKASNPTKIAFIPSHIQDYADNSLDRWINSAVDAKFNYHEDEQYVIRRKDDEDVIQPVDYTNTGITLKNTIWQYGLHQFLQLKHNLHLTSESLTSCFISNLSYIHKYGDEIFGVMGTLGSEAEQELLSSVYNVGYAKIPTYKEKKFTEIVGEVADDEIFCAKVADNVTSEIGSGRAVLVICETIKDAKGIQRVLKSKNIAIKLFFDEENAHVTEEEIKPGDVVIATNIAGRGTDFKTSAELESNNGLHVCVAFLPCNKRVEDQAFGRTSRQGNHGTAQIIVKISELKKLGVDSYSFDIIKNMRDKNEKERIHQVKEIKIPELKFHDELFGLFSNLYREVQEKYQNEVEYKYVLDDLKEFWAFWLEKRDFKSSDLTCKCVNEEFRNFKYEACEIIKGNIQFNPYYSIQQAEYFISKDTKLDKAEKALRHAINISRNPEILCGAYMKLFEIAIERCEVFLNKCKKAVGDLFFNIPIIKPDRDYKEDAKEYLKQAKKAMKKELDYIEKLFENEDFGYIIRSNSSKESEANESQNTENLFIRHLASKQQVLNLNTNYIDSLVQEIDKHPGDFIIDGRVPDYFSSFKPQNDLEAKIKSTIAKSELSELAVLGANVTYSIRKAHDIRPEVIEGARAQILGGLGVITVGACFPFTIPVTNGIGVTMITEGICDIVIDLINSNSNGEFNTEAYIKGKVISYGIAILTMGISAAAKCVKILQAASNACRWIAQTLRKCPFLRSACAKLATKFDKIGAFFEKMAVIAKFKKMTDFQKMKYVQDLISSKNTKHLMYLELNKKQMYSLLTQSAKFVPSEALVLRRVAADVVRNVSIKFAESLIMRTVINPALSSLKPIIRYHVGRSIRQYIDQEKLKYCTYDDIQNIMTEINVIIDYEIINDIFKDAILDAAVYCSDWRIQLAAIAIDAKISWEKVFNYAKDLCQKINHKLECSSECVNKNIGELIKQLTDQLSEEMYAQVVSATEKTCYSIGRARYKQVNKQK